MLCYNHEKYIKEAISSVLNQTFRNFELIIINDCSQDNSEKIINYYIKKDKRIKYLIHKNNLGIAKSLNEGLRLSKGSYLAFLADDDVWKINKLTENLKILKRNQKIDVVWSDFIIIDKNGSLIKQSILSRFKKRNFYPNYLFKILIKKNVICHGSVLMRRRCIRNISFNENLQYLNDYLYWLELSIKYKFYYIPKPLVKYRIHGKNVGNDKLDHAQDTIKLYNIILKKYYKNFKKDTKLFINLQLRISALLYQYEKRKQSNKFFFSALKLILHKPRFSYFFLIFYCLMIRLQCTSKKILKLITKNTI